MWEIRNFTCRSRICLLSHSNVRWSDREVRGRPVPLQYQLWAYCGPGIVTHEWVQGNSITCARARSLALAIPACTCVWTVHNSSSTASTSNLIVGLPLLSCICEIDGNTTILLLPSGCPLVSSSHAKVHSTGCEDNSIPNFKHSIKIEERFSFCRR